MARFGLLLFAFTYLAVAFLLRDYRHAQALWLLSALVSLPVIIIWKPKSVAEFFGAVTLETIGSGLLQAMLRLIRSL